MTEETYTIEPTNGRPKRFKATRLGSVEVESNGGTRIDEFVIFERPGGDYIVQIIKSVHDESTIELQEASDEEGVYEIVGWSSAAHKFYEKQGWDVVEDLDD